ncbi:MAG: class I tRNA ligase family protein, partial [Candidatus Pacebacteria bacterium]|nr:class I tRNA ligase family protein [Candidatus Paceibacterota bacterium]
TVDNQKMSKSIGNVIDPFELTAKYGIDPVRYFLLSEFKTTGDGDFSYAKFENKYNAELSSGLGNLVSRVLTLIQKKNLIGEKIAVGEEFKNQINEYILKCDKHLDNFELNEGINTIWELERYLDKYIEETKPWEINDKEELIKIFSKLVYAIRKIGEMLNPFMPETSEKILSFLGDNENQINVVDKEILFPRLK